MSTNLLQQEIYNSIIEKYNNNLLAYVNIVQAKACSGRLYAILESTKTILNTDKLLTENVYLLTNRDLSIELLFAYNLYKDQMNQKSTDFLLYTLTRIIISTKEEINSSNSDINSLAFDIFNEIDNKKIEQLIKLLEKKKSYKIDDIRALQEQLCKTSNSKNIVIIENLDSSNVSVNNALLKTLEEINTNTYIFILVEQTSSLLDTIKSRAPVLSGKNFVDYKSLLTNYFFETKIDDLETFILVKSKLINLEEIENVVNLLLTNDISINSLNEFFTSKIVINTTLKMLLNNISLVDCDSSKLCSCVNSITQIINEKDLYNQNSVTLSSRLISSLRMLK